MTQLFPKVLIDPEETLFSYLGRSAAFHAKTELVPFLNDFRVRVRDVETGSNGAMERLAELTGQGVDKLTAIHMFSTANRRFRFRGENFGYQFLIRSRRSVCPHCLEEEGGLSPYPGFQRWKVKLLWQFKFCPVCTVHLLVNAWDKSVGFVPMQDVVKAVGNRLPSLIAATRPGRVTSLQRWVASRLLGEKGDSWLDAQDIDQASKAVEMLGLILAHGPKAHLRKLTESDWHEAKQVGFEVASAGPGTIKKSLEHLLDRVQTGRKLQWAPQAHLGPLYQWLYQDDAVSLEAGPIRDIVRDLIAERYYVGHHRRVLGARVKNVRSHLPRSLAAAMGLDHRTAAHIIQDCADWGVTSPCRVEEYAAKYLRSIPESKLPDILNCSRPLVTALKSAFVITPAGFPGRCRMNCRYLPDQLDSSLKKFYQLARKQKPVDDVVDITTCANKLRLPKLKIIKALISKKLEHVYLDERISGVRKVLISPNEVKVKVKR